MMNTLYTIGHSNQSQDEFLTKLQAYGVDCVVDVRSVPASKYFPQFNGDALKWFLRWKGVQYLHFGEEFGARRMDCINDEGLVDCRVGGLARSDGGSWPVGWGVFGSSIFCHKYLAVSLFLIIFAS